MDENVSILKLRCGIHQGKAVVGMFGGGERKDYTAIGTTVNIAARLEEVANPGSILISSVVAAWIEEKEMYQGRSLQLRGIREELLVFSLKVDGLVGANSRSPVQWLIANCLYLDLDDNDIMLQDDQQQ